MTLAYFNDILIDSDVVFRLTITPFNIGDISKRTSTFISSFTCPITEINLRTFGLVGDYRSGSSAAYTRGTLVITDNGIQVFNGYANVSGVKDGKISLTCSIPDIAVFDSLKTTYLCDIDLGSGALDNATMYALRNGVTGVYAPVVNWGKLTPPVDNFLENASFASVPEPWTSESLNSSPPPTIPWTHTAGQFQAILTANTSTFTITNKPFTFYAGYRYRITGSFTLSTANLINVYFTTVVNDKLTLIDNINYTSSGAKTWIVEYMPENQHGHGVGFYAETSGAANTITLTNILIEVDYDTSIKLSYPFYLPLSKYMTVLDESVKLSASGGVSVFGAKSNQDTLMNSLLMGCVRSPVTFCERSINNHKVIASGLGTQILAVDLPDPVVIEFPTIEQTNYGSWAANVYTVPNVAYGYYADIVLSLVVNVTAYVSGNIQARLYLSGVDLDSEIFTSTGRKYITIRTAQSVFHTEGVLMDNISISAALLGVGEYTATMEVAYLTIDQVPYPQGEVVNYSELILPDLSAFDLLRDYVIRTGSLLKYNNNTDTIEVKSVENVITDKHSSIDWTNKRVKGSDDIEFNLNGWAAENFLQDSSYMENVAARGIINLLGDNIPDERVFYESKFNTLKETGVKSVVIANINAFDTDTEKEYRIDGNSTDGYQRIYNFDANESMAIVKSRAELSSDPVIKYGTTTAATYTVSAYLKWSELKTMFYTGLETALQKARVIVREYNLNGIDVYTFDSFKLVFDTDSYFLILKIEYTPERVTKVTMLRVF